MTELTRIGEDDLKKAYMGNEYHPSFKLTLEMKHSLERVAQAQLEADKEKVQEIFDEIEKDFFEFNHSVGLLMVKVLASEGYGKWQAIKQKRGVK